MLAFIINRKNLILDNINPNSMQLGIQKEILDLEVKNKMKRIKAFDPGVLIEQSDECTEEFSRSAMSDRSFSKKEDKENSKSVIISMAAYRQNNLVEKISSFKKFYSAIDLISTVLIIAGAILSVIENDSYYEDNREIRIISVVIINHIRSYGGNHNLIELLKDTDLQYYLNRGLQGSQNITFANEQVLSKYDLLNDFNFSPSPDFRFTDIKIPIVVSSYCNTLRLIITVLSLISGNLIIIICSWTLLY